MKGKRIPLLMLLVLGLVLSGTLAAAGPGDLFGSVPDDGRTPTSDDSVLHPVFPDAYKLAPQQPADVSVPYRSPNHLTHPCGGMFTEPPFEGLSPLSINYVPGMCSGGYGDIAVWQTAGHSYVAQSGFGVRMFHIWNVDDPYNPTLLNTRSFPSGGTASTTIFDFKQGNNYYVSVGMRGSGTGCGYFIYDVTDPANPVQVSRKQGTDWCTVHEHFVSADANGNADFAWLTMSGESGSGYKIVALDLADLANPVETGRYQRPDASGGDNFIHDVTVIGNRVFAAHWQGGLIILDRETLAHNINPTPLNDINSIRPSNFKIHHSWPTSDGNHVFIEDEFHNASNIEKIKMYNIADISNPFYETGIIGQGIDATSQAHNLKIKPISPGLDLLFVGWYKAGTKVFLVDTRGATPSVTRVGNHQLRQTAGPGFGNVWGVDYLPCTIRGQEKTCIYSSDMTYGLYIDALDYDPSLDPYRPESQITDPTAGQTINTCSYTVRGTAHDYYSGVAQVEVSADDGATWSAAQGTTNWTYDWTISADGAYALKARASDVAGNVEAPTTSVSVTVAGNCGAASTPTAVPTDTPVPPTDTPVPPTDTPVPPTNTVVPPTPTNASCGISFTDVHPDDYFYEAVRYLFCAGAISGYGDNTFRPYNETTRGQLSKIVVLAEGWAINTQGGPHFTDVPQGSTFYNFVETAFNAGIITGYGDNTFRPDNNVTRGQLSKIVVLAEEWTINTQGGPHFTDVPQNHTFYDYIETAYNYNIITGYSDGTFRPGNNATRGQISVIVHRALTQR